MSESCPGDEYHDYLLCDHDRRIATTSDWYHLNDDLNDEVDIDNVLDCGPGGNAVYHSCLVNYSGGCGSYDFSGIDGKVRKCWKKKPSGIDYEKFKAQCCSGTASGSNRPLCPEKLCFSDTEGHNDACRQHMTDYCVGDNLNTEECITFCRMNPSECHTRLKEICANKMNEAAWNDVCGCYYPDRVYDDLAEKLAGYGIHAPDSAAECIAPQCQKSPLRDNTVNCPDVINCVNRVEITNEGTIGDVNISSRNECEGFVEQCGEAKCKRSQKCVNQQCITTFTSLISSTFLGDFYFNVRDRLVVKAPYINIEYWKILVVVFLLILVLIVYYQFKK